MLFPSGYRHAPHLTKVLSLDIEFETQHSDYFLSDLFVVRFIT
jgi:hypothetical protein